MNRDPNPETRNQKSKILISNPSVSGLGLWIWGFEFRVSGWGLGVWGFRLRRSISTMNSCAWFRFAFVWVCLCSCLWFCLGRVKGVGYQDSGFGFRFSGFRFRVSGSEFLFSGFAVGAHLVVALHLAFRALSATKMHFKIRVSGPAIACWGFHLSGSRFRVPGFGFRVTGFGFRVPGFGIIVLALGFPVYCLGFWVKCLGCWVSGFGLSISSFGFRGSGSRPAVCLT